MYISIAAGVRGVDCGTVAFNQLTYTGLVFARVWTRFPRGWRLPSPLALFGGKQSKSRLLVADTWATRTASIA
jgi:hypothetical protein